MSDITLDKALDAVMELPLEQQEMLLDIVRNRHIERRRQEIAKDAQESLAAFRAGQLSPKPAKEVITELHQALHEGEG
jgi:hypothetical protein